jgi:ERCC4-related helicase/ERCC4-type nuclease
VFVVHPLLRADSVEARDYQVQLAAIAAKHPTLLVLPTGLGKTMIALLAMLPFLEEQASKKVLVLAPTKPLVEQHARAFSGHLEGVTVESFTGENDPEARAAAWTKARVIVATPQVIENDLVRGIRDLKDVATIVFDEAHRATGNYAYVFIARRYRDAGGTHALGLSASPGSDIPKIQAVLHHLGLERIEIRTDKDPDVQPYIHEVATEWVRVPPTESLVRVVRLLGRCLQRAAISLQRLGYLSAGRATPGKADLLELGRRIRSEMGGAATRRSAFEAASLQARALKIQHALDLAETQGLTVLYHFLARVQAEAEQAGGTKAARDFVREPEFAEALAAARQAPEPHPKVQAAVRLVATRLSQGDRRVLVFANYRETAELIVNGLADVAGCRAHRFVGHARASGEKGLTKKAQQQVVDRFRSGELNVLVATSVAEEGLDLPETDSVILYEPVPSGIRMIQRRGRTGRRSEGRVYVLLTPGTRDEPYYWSALRREKRMHEELAFLRKMTVRQIPLPAPAPLPAPVASPQMELVVDQRETAGPVPKLLLARGVRIKSQTLLVGDYQLPSGALVERKSAADFAASLRDGRLFEQGRRLGEAGRAILVVEGDLAEVTARILPASYHGAVASLIADHGLSVVTVADAQSTADFLFALSRRASLDAKPLPAARFQKRHQTAGEELRFLLEGVPGVGPVLADRLLARFGSVSAVCRASLEELASVEGMGRERARTLHEILNRAYAPSPLAPSLPQPASARVVALEAGDGPAR